MQVWDLIQRDGQRHRHYTGSSVTFTDMDTLLDEADRHEEGFTLRCPCGAWVTTCVVELPDKS